MISRDSKTVFFMLLAAFGFAVQDAVVKLLSVDGSLWQLMFLRSLLVVLLIISWAYFSGKIRKILPRKKFWAFVRAFFMSGAYTLFYASMPFVSVSEASACFFVAPVFVCLFAAVLLGEKIGFWRIGAVFMGLIGVLVVIQPGFDGFKPVLFLPVCAGAFYALAVIITRGFCNEETSFSLMIIHNFFYAMLGSILVSFLTISPFDPNTVISNPFLLTGWVENTKTLLFLIGLTSLTHILAMSSSIVAYQNSEASFLAPLEYSYLIFAAFIDLVIWDFVPSGSQILGALVIVISGATIAWREWSKK